MLLTLEQDKIIKRLRYTMDEYLKIEKEIEINIENEKEGYSFSEKGKLIANELDRNLTLLDNQLTKELEKFKINIHPIELLDTYSESKIRAITILECLVK